MRSIQHLDGLWQACCMPQPVQFRERMWPGMGAIAAAVGMAASLAVAYAAAYGRSIGWLTFACATAAVIIIGIPASPVTIVTKSLLKVGRAGIEKQYLGDAGIVDAVRLRQLRRDRSVRNAYWAVPVGSRTAVAVAVTDADDPHPMWIIGSRRPADLLLALQSEGSSVPSSELD